MNLPRVGILHHPRSVAGLREITKSAVGICEPVIIVQQAVATARPELMQLASRLVDVSVFEDKPLRELGLSGLTTFYDGLLDLVDDALRELELPGVATVADPWDKLVQRQQLVAHGLTRMRVSGVDSVADFERALELVGLPAVLKPRRGAGGDGVALLDGQDDLTHQLTTRTQWQDLLLESRIPDGTHPSGVPWLADFVSVESANTGDGHHHVAVFDKVPVAVGRRGGDNGSDAVSVSGDVVPSRLPDDVRDEVLACVTACLAALGVRWRVTHTEVKLTADGPEIIEVNGRVGGYLNRLLRLVGGDDLVRLALQLATGRAPEPSGTVASGYSMGFFPPFPQRDGAVKSNVSVADLRRLPGVVGVDEIAAYGQSREATNFRMANVTLFAQSVTQLDESAGIVASGLTQLYELDQ